MNIKRLFSFVLVLIMFVPAAYAANDSFGTITDLQLQRSEIVIDDQVYTVDSSTKVKSEDDFNVKNIYQLRIPMGTSFTYRLNANGTKTILDMEVFKEILP